MNNLILFPGVTLLPKTNIKELEIAIEDEEVDNAIYYTFKKMMTVRADAIEELKNAAKLKDPENNILMAVHLELMDKDPVYRNKILSEVHQLICLQNLSIK